MIIIKLEGGLGNQMFQYAIANIIAKKMNSIILIENSSFNQTVKKQGFTPRNFELSIFNNSYKEVSEIETQSFCQLTLIHKLKKKFGLNYPKIYNESSFDFQSDVLSIKAPVYLKGYFQSYKYFSGFENHIRKMFTFPMNKLSSETIGLIPVLKKKNTIAIHIRRGDYISDTITNQYHGSCGKEYYEDAISLVASRVYNPTLAFFSDDPDWVKENFGNHQYNKIFITHNKEQDSWMDMFLMSICNHNIIANSSFSWWGAWLNTNPDKIVVAPKKWFRTKQVDINSIIPAEWLIM